MENTLGDLYRKEILKITLPGSSVLIKTLEFEGLEEVEPNTVPGPYGVGGEQKRLSTLSYSRL